MKITKREMVEGWYTPARSWRAYWVQAGIGLVVAAAILGLLATIANDVPWTLMVGVVLLSLVFSAVQVAFRMRLSLHVMKTLSMMVAVLAAFVMLLAALGAGVGEAELLIWLTLLIAAEVAVVRIRGSQRRQDLP